MANDDQIKVRNQLIFISESILSNPFQNLENILSELTKFSSDAIYQRSKDLLYSEVNKLEAEIAAIKRKNIESENKAAPKPNRIRAELTEHAFDESDKFVKIFIPFNSAGISEDKVRLEVTEDSFSLVVEAESKDHYFFVRNLLKPVVVSGSYKKVKSDMISIYLKKAKEGDKWSYLTKTEKKLKDEKNKTFEQDKDEASNDPMGGLMSIMKKMYDSGDSEMKRTIAKAWTEGQEKKGGAPMF